MEEKFFYWFKEINKIPRGSRNEKAVAEHIYNLCLKKGLESKIDKSYNVVVKKPGTKGFEKSKPVIIQGHTDMVCEKNKGTNHDFTKDPIKVIEENGWLHADGTTLGADNGIAVAYALSILLDETGTIEHPPLEVIFTVSEEIGLIGASAFDNSFFNVQGKKLINLDSFHDDLLTVGCAGGARLRLFYDIKKQATKSGKSLKIFVTGLKGGHSGEDISNGLGNSIVILARTLQHLKNKTSLQVASLKGGDKFNAIPREAEAVITTENPEEVKKLTKAFLDAIRLEFEKTDDGLKIEVSDAPEAKEVLTPELEENLLSAFLILPSTVLGVNPFAKEHVLLSCNIAPVLEIDGKIEISLLMRGGIDTQKERFIEAIKLFGKLTKARFEKDSDYPAWRFKADSLFRDQANKIYKELFGKEMAIYMTHGGLECGILINKIDKDIEAIAIGPNIVGAHTPEEKLEVASAKRMYSYLLKLLSSLK